MRFPETCVQVCKPITAPERTAGSDDFPQVDKVLRKEDHQAFLREFIFDIKDGKHRLLETIPKEKTIVPSACRFA